MRTPGGRDVVEQARELVEALHLDAVAQEERAQAGRGRRDASGPAFVQATFGRWPKMPSRFDLVRAHEPVRERVQAQVGVGGRGRGGVEVDLDRDDLDRDRAARRRAPRGARARPGGMAGSKPERDAARRRRREPGVEHRPVRRRRRESDTPDPSLVAHASTATERAAGAASIDSGDAGARSDRDLRRPHPDDLRHPERLGRRDDARRRDREAVVPLCRTSMVYRDGDTIVARTAARPRRSASRSPVTSTPCRSTTTCPRATSRSTASRTCGAAAPST